MLPPHHLFSRRGSDVHSMGQQPSSIFSFRGCSGTDKTHRQAMGNSYCKRQPPFTKPEQLLQQGGLFLLILVSEYTVSFFSVRVFLGWPQFTLHASLLCQECKLNICVKKEEHLKCPHLGYFIPAAVYNSCKTVLKYLYTK